MLEGRVTVNGATIRALGSKAELTDDIRVDGRRVKFPDHHVYLLLNKPRGYVTTRSDPERRPTVLDLVRVREYVYPVGRLDYESEGLLLLTNDGELAARLTHPSHAVARVYEARVLGSLDEHDIQRLARGIEFDGQRTAPAEIERLSDRSDRTTIRLTLTEGRNRQVRKMCEAIGHPVEYLRRVAIGPLRDYRLKVGDWRPLTADEVTRLKRAAGEPVPSGRAPRKARSASRR